MTSPRNYVTYKCTGIPQAIRQMTHQTYRASRSKWTSTLMVRQTDRQTDNFIGLAEASGLAHSWSDRQTDGLTDRQKHRACRSK